MTASDDAWAAYQVKLNAHNLTPNEFEMARIDYLSGFEDGRNATKGTQ